MQAGLEAKGRGQLFMVREPLAVASLAFSQAGEGRLPGEEGSPARRGRAVAAQAHVLRFLFLGIAFLKRISGHRTRGTLGLFLTVPRAIPERRTGIQNGKPKLQG